MRNTTQDNLANLMETLECQETETDLYWSKEGNIYSLYSQSQDAYSKPLAVIIVEAV
jgi:hypothetical protein